MSNTRNSAEQLKKTTTTMKQFKPLKVLLRAIVLAIFALSTAAEVVAYHLNDSAWLVTLPVYFALLATLYILSNTYD